MSRTRAYSNQMLRLRRTIDCFPPRCAAPRRSLIPTSAVSLGFPKPHDQYLQRAQLSSVAALCQSAPVSRSTNRGPVSKEDTQTDFGSLNVLGNTPPPTTSIDACLADGFHLDNGLKIGGGSGCLLVAGEAFSWRPWEVSGKAGGSDKRAMLNTKGQWAVEKGAWGILDLVWPKPGMASFLSLYLSCVATPF